MPIYEFRCEACGASFERLVEAGTESSNCPNCEADEASRVYSAQAAPFRLVKTRRDAGKQERRNSKLRESTKARFKEARRRARSGDGKARGS
jgi:putative FmdB family regulatory protein